MWMLYKEMASHGNSSTFCVTRRSRLPTNPYAGSASRGSCSSSRYSLWGSARPWPSLRQSACLIFHTRHTLLFIFTRTAAIGFPIVIFLLVPVRTYLVPRLPFTEEELAILDGPTASPFVSHILHCISTELLINMFADDGVRRWSESIVRMLVYIRKRDIPTE